MNSKVVWVLGFVSLGAIACSSAESERPVGTSEQSIGVLDEGGLLCSHPICATGGPLVAVCDVCATALCALDPYCCSTAWDATCVGEVASICGKTCSTPTDPPPGGGGTCAHPVCAAGAPLTSGCEPCATQLCAQDPYCCAVAWDATCVGEVGAICGPICN